MKTKFITYRKPSLLVALALCTLLLSCRKEAPRGLGVFRSANTAATAPDLWDIQQTGELIIATLYGPDTYFEHQGEPFGTQYLLADAYARSIGCTLRVDVVRTPEALLSHLQDGDADIVACTTAVTDSLRDEFQVVGQNELTRFTKAADTPVAWLLRKDTPDLAQSLTQWMHDNQDRFAAITTPTFSDSEGHIYTPRRRNYSPILNMAKGQISQYDHLLRRYSTTIHWDWRLLAAQAYQESTFDPNAVSHMGAMGLMQLMPATARSVGVDMAHIFDPETNLRGAVAYIAQLDRHYADIANPTERIRFILAAYNAGPGHIDDARSLAAAAGRDPSRWTSSVDHFVLSLSQPQYYNDPLATHGYMRGSETYNYVASILQRWEEYRKISR